MMLLRSDAAALFRLILATVCVGLAAGCGSGGGSADQAVRTDAMEKHLQGVKQNYGKQIADSYRGKPSQKYSAKNR
jgi:hypothetical protein